MAIICGPIVRHATRDEINIWFVVDSLTESCQLDIYSNKAFDTNINSRSTYLSLKLGQSCFAVMITAKLNLPPKCQLLYYDIRIGGKGFRDTGFNELICFESEQLPSVRLPKKHRHFLQASCRKPHDYECIDQLEAAADLVRDRIGKAARPSQLFLTGDQIYADDVSPVLLYSFRSLRKSLGIKSERIPKEGSGTLDPESDEVKLDDREKIANPQAGFTSGHGDSQLLAFSEYICMYLFAFGGKIPGHELPEYEEISRHLYEIKVKVNKVDRLRPEYTINDYRKDIRALDAFVTTIDNHVRKLFANIAVYMIFDDHEVTDDWNLAEENYLNLKTSRTGRHVYVNALAAYLICQHWGNFPSCINANVAEKLQLLAAIPTIKNHMALEILWEWNWGYVLDQSPPIAVIDTRTGRSYARGHLALMSKERIFKLGEDLSKLNASPTLILVSPTPVYGLSEAEAFQLKLGDSFKTFADQEPWVASEFALAFLQSQLTRVPEVRDIVIFSGDVHYAFSRREVIPVTGTRYWQFCSSATCNSPMGGNQGVNTLKRAGSFFDKKTTKYLVPSGDCNQILTSDKNIGLLELSVSLSPLQAILMCRRRNGEKYQKIYDLAHPIEFRARK